jgi:hypothetical protein
MAWTTPYTFIALQALTAAQLNAVQANITTLFPYTSAGDLAYASSSTVLSRLEKGTAGQVLKMNSGATAPEWGEGNIFRGAHVKRDANQSINNTTYTVVTFDGEVFDTDSMYAPGSPTILTAQRTGYFLIGSNVVFSGSPTNIASRIYLDAVSLSYQFASGQTFLQNIIVASVTAGQEISLQVYQSSGGALNAGAGTKLWAYFVG